MPTSPPDASRPSVHHAHLRPRASLSNSISLGPQSLLQSLALLSPHPGRRPPVLDDDSPTMPEEDEEVNWSMVDRFRLWRHDAMMQHLYETAVFWGDKVLSWTNDPNDAFWLAQTHFLTNQYSRAERLLTRPWPVNRPRSLNIKGKERADANGHSLGILGGIHVPQDATASRLVDMSVACRYLAAQCSVRLGKWQDALEMLGEANPFRGLGLSGPRVPNSDGGIKVESSMCYLRGILMLRLNRTDAAKENLMEALSLDVKNFDAFEVLIGGEMMGIDEEWAFVQGLEYKQQTSEDAEFVRSIYTIRLKKYKHTDEITLCRERLMEEYGLSENPDVLFGYADQLYTQYRWVDCYAITSKILELRNFHSPALAVHLACMQHISHLHPKLFLLAHELVEREPDAPISWYAVGVWYFITGKYTEARKYFSKTSLMDPRFGPAWIAFAHSFALEGEHEQAVIAYSTSARLFQGSHLPLLFIGMEHIQLFNVTLAEEHLEAAFKMCDSDPLLLNELGVLAYQKKQFDRAVKLFNEALQLAKVIPGAESKWATTYLNLGQAYRKLGMYEQAKVAFKRVVEINPYHPQGLACLGMMNHLMNEISDAILRYHEALGVDPLNTNIIDLMNLALAANSEINPLTLGARGASIDDTSEMDMGH